MPLSERQILKNWLTEVDQETVVTRLETVFNLLSTNQQNNARTAIRNDLIAARESKKASLDTVLQRLIDEV